MACKRSGVRIPVAPRPTPTGGCSVGVFLFLGVVFLGIQFNVGFGKKSADYLEKLRSRLVEVQDADMG